MDARRLHGKGHPRDLFVFGVFWCAGFEHEYSFPDEGDFTCCGFYVHIDNGTRANCSADGQDIKGAKVTVTCLECGTVFETETDFLGDFEVQGLPSNKPFRVEICAEGYEPKTLECRTAASVNLGEIYL